MKKFKKIIGIFVLALILLVPFNLEVKAEMSSNSFLIREDSFSMDSVAFDGDIFSEGSLFGDDIFLSSEINVFDFSSMTTDSGNFTFESGYHAMLFNDYTNFSYSPTVLGTRREIVEVISVIQDTNTIFDGIFNEIRVNDFNWLDLNVFGEDQGEDVYEVVFLMERNLGGNDQAFGVGSYEIANNRENASIVTESGFFGESISNIKEPLQQGDAVYLLNFNANAVDDNVDFQDLYQPMVDFGMLSPSGVAQILLVTLGSIENPAGYEIWASMSPLIGQNTGTVIPNVQGGAVQPGTPSFGFQTIFGSEDLDNDFDKEDKGLTEQPQMVFKKTGFSSNDLGVYRIRIAIDEDTPEDVYNADIFLTYVSRF